jgi:CRISPR-associated protein Csm4
LRLIFTDEHYCSEGDLFELHLASLPAAQQKKLKLLPGTHRKFSGVFEQAHNTLNRLTNTTGTGEFAPFSAENIHYLPHARLAIFVLIDEQATDIDRVKNAFINMGSWGFGRDASAGLGRFSVVDIQALQVQESSGRPRYTLAPCVPEKEKFSASFFTPFTRFGKHGAALIHQNKPFKNPVVMADEGAVFVPADQQQSGKPYIGGAVTGLSKADDRTVMQGYAITLPCELEEAL